MNVGDIMTQEVISIAPDASVAAAATLMLEQHISGLPVINAAHALVGILTEGDLLRRTEIATDKRRPRWLEIIVGQNTLANEYIHSHGRKVSEVMTKDVVVATEDMPLDKAVDLMERRRVKRLPVVREGRVVGILGRANLLHALAASPPEAAHADDKTIQSQIEKELSKKRWNPKFPHCVVKDGTVDVWGYVTSKAQRDAIHVAIRNVPGVKKMRDHLAWVDPYSGIVLDLGVDTRDDIVH